MQVSAINRPAAIQAGDERAEPSTSRQFAIGIATFMAVLGLLLAIPHDPFVRWQSVRTEAYARLGWSYQRIHFDPTPLDIAFVGTSHTMNGINGHVVAEELARRGVRGEGGECLTVTNLAIPSYGRNLHYAMVRELLSVRKPRAIVLEVLENETRKAHPLFSHVATGADMWDAPGLGNVNYLSDLSRLPYRQLVLGLQSLSPEQFGLKSAFDPRDYDGSDVDNTYVVNVDGRALTPPLVGSMAPADLEREAAALDAAKQLHYLPPAFEDVEYAMPRRYVRDLLALADREGVPVLLLYLPGYGKPAAPVDTRLYGNRPLLTVNELLARKPYWHDVHHLNASGAKDVSHRLGELLSTSLASDAPTGVVGVPPADCNFGIAQRPLRSRLAAGTGAETASAD